MSASVTIAHNTLRRPCPVAPPVHNRPGRAASRVLRARAAGLVRISVIPEACWLGGRHPPYGGRSRAMLLLGAHTNSSPAREVWTARRGICAHPEDVLHALTDPDTIAEWAPVSFEVDGLAGGCLEAGSYERVSGSIAGVGTTFEIEVRRADVERLELVARGPISFDVAYRFHRGDDEVLVEATVGLRRHRGLAAQILRAGAVALLNTGALTSALRRLESAVACPVGDELIAA